MKHSNEDSRKLSKAADSYLTVSYDSYADSYYGLTNFPEADWDFCIPSFLEQMASVDESY